MMKKREVSGCIHGNQLSIDGVVRYLPPRLLAKENQKTVVEHISLHLERLSALTGHDKNEVWGKITALMTDLASENHHLAKRLLITSTLLMYLGCPGVIYTPVLPGIGIFQCFMKAWRARLERKR